MAEHRRDERNNGHNHGLQSHSIVASIRPSSDLHSIGDDEPAMDVDEPPDNRLQFMRLPAPYLSGMIPQAGPRPLQRTPKESMLTRGLTSPDLLPMSDMSIAELTSDGGLTTPNTPSPPLPTTQHPGLPPLSSTGLMALDNDDNKTMPETAQPNTSSQTLQNTTVEAGLGRKRCITFACGRQPASKSTNEHAAERGTVDQEATKPAEEPKRPCILRFACPLKPIRRATQVLVTDTKIPIPVERPSVESTIYSDTPLNSRPRQHRDSESTIKNEPTGSVSRSPRGSRLRSPIVSRSRKLEQSEATRFHEFASSMKHDDEWMNQRAVHGHRITVNDTLRKENAIRKIGREAEEEAIEEEQEENDIEAEEMDDDNSDNDEFDDGMDPSDGGNESDNEQGFADSDDESDAGSHYSFWTPALTTAATSTEHFEHIRPISRRIKSDSSIESIMDLQKEQSRRFDFPKGNRKRLRGRKSPRMRPGTPELPDSTDFVCGTLDEDRPLEVAYISCREERRRARHKLVPQDIDPSFPSSDSDDAQDEDDEEDNEDSLVAEGSDDHMWIMGRPEHSDQEPTLNAKRPLIPRRTTKSPLPSPKRFRSPPPPKRRMTHKSPPPRRLFGQSPRRLRSPGPPLRQLHSPPSTRHASPSSKRRAQQIHGVEMPLLAQRPNLTHTKSLPRTPNPFWRQPRNMDRNKDQDNRGPIDIVRGLEQRRQRRKEKICRNAYKEKEWRCQPGKGVERMKDIGLEMAGRCRTTGQKSEHILSA